MARSTYHYLTFSMCHSYIHGLDKEHRQAANRQDSRQAGWKKTMILGIWTPACALSLPPIPW